MLKIFIYTSFIIIQAFQLPRNTQREWHGNWFPQPPGVDDDRPVVDYVPRNDDEELEVDSNPDRTESHTHMGVVDDTCDNAEVNLTMDWDNSPINFTCYENKENYLPSFDVSPIIHCDHIPGYYRAEHICMNSSIEYDDVVPTFGPHRPIWGKYGEYLFIPKQRWVHNLEHGAVVMLYHPCANKNEVLLLKHLLQRCLYRHIITPYTLLSRHRPLALVTWGCRFSMSKVDVNLVLEFITHAALRGPEFTSKDGQFDFGLIRHASVVSDPGDTFVCPM